MNAAAQRFHQIDHLAAILGQPRLLDLPAGCLALNQLAQRQGKPEVALSSRRAVPCRTPFGRGSSRCAGFPGLATKGRCQADSINRHRPAFSGSAPAAACGVGNRRRRFVARRISGPSAGHACAADRERLRRPVPGNPSCGRGRVGRSPARFLDQTAPASLALRLIPCGRAARTSRTAQNRPRKLAVCGNVPTLTA